VIAFFVSTCGSLSRALFLWWDKKVFTLWYKTNVYLITKGGDDMSFTFKTSKEFLETLRSESKKREMTVAGFIRFCVFEFINK
jgi:hypothetical protein